MGNGEDIRKTDTEPDNVAHFRAGSRIFRMNNEWYFSSREGEHGPFQTEQGAVMELETYVKLAGVPEAVEDSPFEVDEESARKRADPKIWDQFDNLS